MRSGLAAIAILLLLAGCQGSPPHEAMVATSVPASAPVQATIYGTVFDDEARPMAGAVVTLVEASAQKITGNDGSFLFDKVGQGTYTVVFTAEHYAPVTKQVRLVGDLGERVDASLVKLAEFVPHNETLLLHGNYDCAAEYLIITGNCGIIWNAATCAAGACSDDPFFTQKYEFRFNVSQHWDTVLAEMTWTQNPTNAFSGMRLYVENTNISQEAGHSKSVARAIGNDQPLTTRIDRGHIHAEAETYNGTTAKAFIPDDGGTEQIRVFPEGEMYDMTRQVCSPSAGCFLGVGAGVNIAFDVYLTIFYNGAAPAGFSAVPDAR